MFLDECFEQGLQGAIPESICYRAEEAIPDIQRADVPARFKGCVKGPSEG